MGNRSTADPDGLLAGRGPGAGAAAGLAGPGAAALVGGVLLIGAVLAGNSLVCVSVATERALQTPTNSFIVSLAAADLLLALLVLPLFVYSEVQGGAWLLSPRLCDALMAMDVMLCTASIFNLCAISVDRRRPSRCAPTPDPTADPQEAACQDHRPGAQGHEGPACGSRRCVLPAPCPRGWLVRSPGWATSTAPSTPSSTLSSTPSSAMSSARPCVPAAEPDPHPHPPRPGHRPGGQASGTKDMGRAVLYVN
ncbi:D(4) dopamine receptor isoform X3 [Macaca fascicularis]|uniref:D(4) dopamine receptor isoform X3 n=1 Tax=Macaca fascicularis TaxID=9541 RepID=UPI003D15A96D